MLVMITVILAGGRGERLRPLTDTVPKPLLEVNGKPVLEWQLEQLKKHYLTDVVICGHHLFNAIVEHFSRSSSDANILYAHEREPLGTGGALKNLERFLASPFLVLYGDILLKFNFTRLIKYHQKKKGIATVVVHRTSHPEDSDMVLLDKNSRITALLGRGGASEVAKSSIYVLNPAVFRYMPRSQHSFENNVLPKLVRKEKVYGYLSNEFVMDVGTPQRYEEAQSRWK